MKRWVNDYNITEKVSLGYRHVLPLEIKAVGAGTQAMLMEITDTDYKKRQYDKQAKNDLQIPGGGTDLERYKEDINAEVICFLSYNLSKWEAVVLMFRKLFNCGRTKYIKKLLKYKKPENIWVQTEDEIDLY